MKNYKIEVQETLSKVVNVQASSEEEALIIIKDKYRKEEIVLEPDDFVSVEYIPLNED